MGNDTVVNRQEVSDSFEMWFGLEEGGTQAHADAYCETTISMQIRGKKVWRMGLSQTSPTRSNRTHFTMATFIGPIGSGSQSTKRLWSQANVSSFPWATS